MTLTPAHFQRYYSARLGRQLRPGNNALPCIFHDDKAPSLSVNTEAGVWFCHAGCGSGGVKDFEKLYRQCDDATAWKNIGEIVGESLAYSGEPVAEYIYADNLGRELLKKLKYRRDEKTKFCVWYKRDGEKWTKCDGDRGTVPLYRLPDVITANLVFVVEGEKDADRLDFEIPKAPVAQKYRLAATSNPDGAGKWRDEYSPYLAGRTVIVIPDHDEAGRKHAEQVARSVFPFAAGVKIVTLPELPEKGDVSDYLDAHSIEDLLAEVKKAPAWHPPAAESGTFFVGGWKFANMVADETDWYVKWLIPVGWNGFVIANPKSLKSLSIHDLAIHLAYGIDWLGLHIPNRLKVGMLAREDHYSGTSRRTKQFLRGLVRDGLLTPERCFELDDWMWFNTREQAATWYLDNESDRAEVIRNVQERGIQFLILDVFRRLHTADEQSNTEMQKVLDNVAEIQAKAKCSVAIVHHTYKNVGEQEDIFMAARGASAIHGFMEFGIGLLTMNPDAPDEEKVRRMSFLSKASRAPKPLWVKPEGGEEEGWLRLARTDAPPNTTGKMFGRQ